MVHIILRNLSRIWILHVHAHKTHYDEQYKTYDWAKTSKCLKEKNNKLITCTTQRFNVPPKFEIWEEFLGVQISLSLKTRANFSHPLPWIWIKQHISTHKTTSIKLFAHKTHFDAQSEAAKTQFIEEKKNINELKILLL